MPAGFQSTYKTLVGIRNDLEKLSLTQAWSLRETDLYDYQRQLDRIDESRINGNFQDKDGNPAELYVQRVSVPLSIINPKLMYYPDFTLPDSPQLRIYLLPHGLLRASI
jgi:hypothetical protein